MKSKEEENINIYLSLPSTTISSYFFLLGVLDEHIKSEISNDDLIEEFKRLDKGDIIHHLEDEVWKRCSVMGKIEKGMTSPDSWHLKIRKEKKTAHSIPINQWRTRIRITDRNENRILTTRRSKNLIGVSNELRLLFGDEKMNIQETLNIAACSIVGVRTKFERNLDLLELKYKEFQILFNQVLVGEVEATYRNIKWVSENDVPNIDNGLVVVIGANKGLNVIESKKVNKFVIVNQLEQLDGNQLLLERLQQKELLEEVTIITGEIQALLENKMTCVFPSGVELIAWRDV